MTETDQNEDDTAAMQTEESRIIEEQAAFLAGVAGVSPKQRYLRFEESLGESALHNSYQAFDTKNGMQVAWHTVHLDKLRENEMNRVLHIVQLLRAMQHKNVQNFLDNWVDGTQSAQSKMAIITSCHDSLKEFALKKCSHLRWRIVKKWCRQILRGLEFLHNSQPPIIHRNLTCSHIYIDGGFGGIGAINIGDLWLSAQLVESADPVQLSASMVNYLTRENSTSHIPPEVFAGQPLTPKADIYSFGMCILEILTRDEKEPFKECLGDLSKVQRRVLRGETPLVLLRITNPEALDFVRQCLSPVESRPTATELLQHAFISSSDDDESEIVLADASLAISTKKSENFEPELASPNGSVVVPTGTILSISNSDVQELESLGSSVSYLENTRTSFLQEFQTGENLYQDRGVHDGRREDDGKGDAPDDSVSIFPVEPRDDSQQIEKSGLVSYTFIVTATEEGPQVGYEFNVRTHMHYANGAITEIDFPFNTTTDNFEAVSQDFLTEFPLGITVEELASTLMQKVNECATARSLVPAATSEVNGQGPRLGDGEEEGAEAAVDLHEEDDDSTEPGGGNATGGEFFDNATSMAASSLTLSESSSISSLEDGGNVALQSSNPNPHGEELAFEHMGGDNDHTGVLSSQGVADGTTTANGGALATGAVGAQNNLGLGALQDDAEVNDANLAIAISESGTGTDLGTGTIGERSSSLTHAAVAQNRARVIRVQGDVGSADDITVSTAFSTVRFAQTDRFSSDNCLAGGDGEISALTVDDQPIESSSAEKRQDFSPVSPILFNPDSGEKATKFIEEQEKLKEGNETGQDLQLEAVKIQLRLELGDDKNTIFQEIQKLEKESKAAKSAFEQRIKKHKISQEACEQDILALDKDRESKLQNLAKKEESIEKAIRKDIAKWEDDFEKHIEDYVRGKIVEMRRNAKEISPVQQTQALPPGKDDSNY